MTLQQHVVWIALIGLGFAGCAKQTSWNPGATQQSWKSGSVSPSRPGDAKIVDPKAVDMEAAASRSSRVAGRAAPAFALPDHTGHNFRLADMRGKWVVLYFYPKDDTPGCVCQATEFTGLLTQFRYMNAAVIGVSPDTVKNHQHFREKYSLGITLLSDVDRKVMRAYGAWTDVRLGDQVTGRVIRSTYIIDPTGRIAWHWPEVIPKGHAERVKAKLDELSRRS